MFRFASSSHLPHPDPHRVSFSASSLPLLRLVLRVPFSLRAACNAPIVLLALVAARHGPLICSVVRHTWLQRNLTSTYNSLVIPCLSVSLVLYALI